MAESGLKYIVDDGFTRHDAYSRHIDVSVSDLMQVYPELHQCDETYADFAKKVRIAAEHMRGMDAVYDLHGLLSQDTVSTKIFDSEDSDD